jgi:gamma-glutamyltranspeptidase/glutathione hydrolase
LRAWGWATLGLLCCASLACAQGEAVVSASHPLAAQAGIERLRAGGNAIDAAAAMQFVLNVVEPQSSGIGGGAFLLIHLAATGENVVIDAREVAPATASADQFAAHSYDENSTNGIAVGVPGTLAGFAEAQQRWGKQTLADVLAPAIGLARDGFAITPYLAHSLQNPRAALQPETKALFRDDAGAPLAEGAWLKQLDLAHTFQLIAEQGPRVFYQGEIARAVMAAQRRSNIGPAGAGRMTLSDLANYQVVLRTPLVGQHRGYTIVTMPPPSSGGVALLQTLSILERFSLGKSAPTNASISTHVTIEALRLAMADRAYWMGDPAATRIPLTSLLADEYLAQRSALINAQVRMSSATTGLEKEGRHTTHFSVVDREGNVVSCTSTVEDAWGSGIMVPGYGFMLNNELTDFNRVPKQSAQDPGANDVRPNMRPRSSMAPILVLRDGQWLFAYGSPGGSTIISTMLETTQNLLDFNLSPTEAIAHARFAVLDASGNTEMENSTSEFLVSRLKALGHMLQESPEPQGSVQLVGENALTHERWGVADSRREGTVLRYSTPVIQ